MNVDEYGRVHYSIKEILELLYHRPDFDLSQVAIAKTESEKFNKHCEELLEDLMLLSDHNAITEDIDDFHKLKLSTWYMPEEYQKFDIENYCIISSK